MNDSADLYLIETNEFTEKKGKVDLRASLDDLY
jgi:hypothetical protein